MKHASPAPRRRADRGFTMVEILAVVIVLGILSAIAVPQYLSHRSKARVAAAVSDARSTGEIVEEAWAKDRRYPDNPSEVAGWRLSENNEIARYEVDNTGTNAGFALCVVYKEGATVKAFAVYDSRNGGIVGKGSGDGGTLCTPNQTTPPAPADSTGGGGGGSTGGGGDGSGGGGGGGSSSLAAPADLTVDTVDGIARATLTWQAVDGADGYAVFLDGATTAAWTGTALTTDLTGLARGVHEVTVRATEGGDRSDPSNPATFTIYGDNDFIANAHPVKAEAGGAVWRSGDYNNAGKTVETGEPADNLLSMWWTYTPARSTTIQIKVIAASDGTGPFSYPSLYVWQTSATDVTALGTQIRKQTGSGGTSGRIENLPVEAGKTYKIRISSMSTGWNAKYRLEVAPGPANDNLADAASVTGLTPNSPWRSIDVDNTYAGTETGEPSGSGGSTWWTMVAPRTATYTVSVVQASDGSTLFSYPGIAAWQTSTTDVTQLGTAIQSRSGSGGRSNLLLSLTQGETYKIQVTSMSPGWRSKFRLEVAPGPENDSLIDAAVVTGVAAGTPWFSPDVDNKWAGPQTAEPGNSGGSMWWSYTASHSGTYRVYVSPATDGTPVYSYPGIAMWQSTTTDVTQLGTPMAIRSGSGGNPYLTVTLTAGQTYKIQTSSMSEGWRSKYRLQIQS